MQTLSHQIKFVLQRPGFREVACLCLLALSVLPTQALAQRSSVGRGVGVDSARLEGFDGDKAQARKLREAINQAHALVAGLQLDTVSRFPELFFLANELVAGKYVKARQERELAPNRFPGDYGVAGGLVASTDLVRGAPTQIFAGFQELSPAQMVQAVIHEALYRSLPEPMNQHESVVDRITGILTQNPDPRATLDSYFALLRDKKLAWPVVFRETGDFGHDVVILHCNEARQRLMLNLQNAGLVVVVTDHPTRMAISIVCNTFEDLASPRGFVEVLDQYRKESRLLDLMSENPAAKPNLARYESYAPLSVFESKETANAVSRALGQLIEESR